MTPKLEDAVNAVMDTKFCDDADFINLMTALWYKLEDQPDADDVEEALMAIGEFVPADR